MMPPDTAHRQCAFPQLELPYDTYVTNTVGSTRTRANTTAEITIPIGDAIYLDNRKLYFPLSSQSQVQGARA
jgi:hypothetical protein